MGLETDISATLDLPLLLRWWDLLIESSERWVVIGSLIPAKTGLFSKRVVITRRCELSTKAALGSAVCRKNQKLFWPISTFIIVSWKVLGRRVERTALKHRLPCAPCGRPQPLATVPAKRYPRPILIKNHRHMAPHASTSHKPIESNLTYHDSHYKSQRYG